VSIRARSVGRELFGACARAGAGSEVRVDTGQSRKSRRDVGEYGTRRMYQGEIRG
jgi:hypothetical protein